MISLHIDNPATPKMNIKCPSLPNLEAKRSPEYTTSLSYTPTTKYFEDFTIAIDWDPTALHLRYQSTLERVSKMMKGFFWKSCGNYLTYFHCSFGSIMKPSPYAGGSKLNPLIWIIVSAPLPLKRSWSSGITAVTVRARNLQQRNCKYGSYHQFW